MTAERIPGDRDPSQHDGRFEKRETMIEAAMREKHRVALVIFRAIEMYRYYRDQPDFEQRLDTVLNGLAPEHSSTPVEKIREAFQRMAKQEAQMIKAEQILNKITGSAKVSADVREENVGKYLFYVKTGKGGVARAKRHGGVMKLVVSEIDWKKICPGGDIGSGFFDSNFHSLQYSGETIQMPCFCLRAGVEEDRSDDHEEQHFFNTFATQLFVDLEVAGSGRNIQQYGPTRHTKDELLARIRDQSPASMAVNFIDFTETEYSRGYRWIADELEPPQLESQIKKLRSIEKPLENIEKIFQTREERELLTIMLMGIPLERMDFLLPIMNEYFNDLVQKSVWGRSALFQTPEETAREEGYESAFAMGNEQWQICLDKAMVAKRLFTSFSHQISLEDVTPEEAVVALNAKHERILEAARAVNSENVKRVENYCRGEMKAYTAYEAFRQTFANTDDDPDATPRRLLFSNWEKRLFEKVAGHADYPENFTAKLIGDTWVLFIYDSFQNCGLNSGSTDTTIPANTAEVESQVVENGPTIHIKAVEAKGCFYNIQRVVQTDLIRRFIYGQFLDDKEPAPVGSMRQTQSAQHCIKTRAISFLEADYFDLATLRKRQLNMPDKIVGQNENVVNDKKIVDVLKKLVQFIEEEKDFYLLIRDEFSYLLFSAPFLQWPELFNRVRSEVRNLGVNISEIRSRINENYYIKELAKCFVGKKIYRADADSGALNLEEAARYLVNKDGGEIHETLVEVIRSVIGLGETSVTVAFKRIETLKRQEKEAVQKFLEFYRDLMRRDEKDRIQPYILLEEPPQELDVMLEQQFLDGIKELDNDLRSPKSQHLPELRQTKYGSSLGESGFKLLWQNKFSPGYVVKVLADQQRRSRLPTYESEFKELRVDVGGRQRKVHEWNISVVVRTPQDKNFTFRANVIVYD